MNITLLLPWFPIILGVGVGGRLLGRGRGLALGAVCALFWIVLIQASAGPRIWTQNWSVAAIVVGGVAITLMGGWSGQSPVDSNSYAKHGSQGGSRFGESFFHGASGPRSTASVPPGDASLGAAHGETLDEWPERLAAACHRFDDWIEEHRTSIDLWPAFGEFIREVLFQMCRATHVKPYRALPGGGGWAPLRDTDGVDGCENSLPYPEIAGEVVASGRSYVEPAQGGHCRAMNGTADGRRSELPAWCFAIHGGRLCLGVVNVGCLEARELIPSSLLPAIEQLVAQFWRTVSEASVNRTVGRQDSASGLLNRESFMEQSENALRESQQQSEPAAVAMIAIHGLRELNDNGKWEIADELIREVGRSLGEKVRLDDRLGRFDGSRFVWLLRRVDSELAGLIVRQVVSRLETLCGDRKRWQASIAVRCGLVGGDAESVDIRTLVSQALVQSRRARMENIPIAADLRGVRNAATVGTIG